MLANTPKPRIKNNANILSAGSKHRREYNSSVAREINIKSILLYQWEQDLSHLTEFPGVFSITAVIPTRCSTFLFRRAFRFSQNVGSPENSRGIFEPTPRVICIRLILINAPASCSSETRRCPRSGAGVKWRTPPPRPHDGSLRTEVAPRREFGERNRSNYAHARSRGTRRRRADENWLNCGMQICVNSVFQLHCAPMAVPRSVASWIMRSRKITQYCTYAIVFYYKYS